MGAGVVGNGARCKREHVQVIDAQTIKHLCMFEILYIFECWHSWKSESQIDMCLHEKMCDVLRISRQAWSSHAHLFYLELENGLGLHFLLMRATCSEDSDDILKEQDCGRE